MSPLFTMGPAATRIDRILTINFSTP